MKQNNYQQQHSSFDQITIASSSTLSTIKNDNCLPYAAKKTVRRLCSSISKFGPRSPPPPPLCRKVSAPGSGGKQRKSSIPSALLPSLIVATVGGDTPDSGLRMDFAFGRTDLPGPRIRSNSCSGLPNDQQQIKIGCIGDEQLNSSNFALNKFSIAKDPVLESNLAIRKISQAFVNPLLTKKKKKINIIYFYHPFHHLI
ncbi:hypothetical protein Mgra_00000925 [Meloidogyne graminicola]|uniref:Uncharacterized protein n=1 Tax=Meloidogyne graminicola TaxID=189291 RepID=A0A8T0A1Y6_9BILA|nr:hypothetical protein Mgra_00000925 [Meloidogyne graminicola]